MLTDGLTARQDGATPEGGGDIPGVQVADVAQLLLAGVKGER